MEKSFFLLLFLLILLMRQIQNKGEVGVVTANTKAVFRVRQVPHRRATDLIYVCLEGMHCLCSLGPFCTLFELLDNARHPGLPRTSRDQSRAKGCRRPSEEQLCVSQEQCLSPAMTPPKSAASF